MGITRASINMGNKPSPQPARAKKVRPLNRTEIKRIIAIATTYDVTRKYELRTLLHRLAHQIAQTLKLPEGSYDVRFNAGGPAVMGDTTLHGEHIYVDLSPSCTGPWFYYRSCKGRKDYTGGPNNNALHTDLLRLDKLIADMRTILDAVPAA